MTTRDAWQPVWATAPGVVTADLRGARWDACRHSGSGELAPVEVADAAGVAACEPEAIVVTAENGVAPGGLAAHAAARGVDVTVVRRREALAAGATGGFGGMCIAIDCEDEVSVDFADGARFMRGSTLLGRADAESDAAWAAMIDAAIVATAQKAGADGPLLVITGRDAEAYCRFGALPVQHVPELIHRGMVVLWKRERSRTA